MRSTERPTCSSMSVHLFCFRGVGAIWKRCYGRRGKRWRGLAKATAQVHFTAIAYNLKRTRSIVMAAV